jgi:hypothetical protein
MSSNRLLAGSLVLFLLWAAGIGAFYVLAPEALLALLERFISHDGEITRFQNTVFKLVVAFGLALLLALTGIESGRRFGFPGRLLWLYLLWFTGYYLFYRWYVQTVLQNGPFEDSLLEWGTFAFAMLATVIFLALGFRGMRLAFVLAVGFFVFGGEEISWGDRIFNFRTPELFVNYNVQMETNLHNFFNSTFGWLYSTVNFAAFLALTWGRRFGWLAALYRGAGMVRLIRVSDRSGFWLIPLVLVLASVFPGDEFVEELWSLAGTLLALLLWRDLRRG